MEDIERISAFCRRNPNLATITLLFAACIYGLISQVVSLVDTSSMNQFTSLFFDIGRYSTSVCGIALCLLAIGVQLTGRFLLEGLGGITRR